MDDRSRDAFARFQLNELEAQGKSRMYTRQETWELEYLRRQYMRELSDRELETRFEDVFVNLSALNREGKITSRGWAKPMSFGRLFNDILVEKRLRGQGLRGGQQFERYGALSRRYVGQSCVVPQQLWNRPYLFKVGRFDFLQEALQYGRLRVCPSTFYSNPLLNPGMHDVEGVIELVVTPSDQAWHMRSEGMAVPDGLQIFRGYHRAASPYFMWCCSDVFRPEIAANFEGDACLVVRDEVRFRNRYAVEMRRALGVGSRAGKVQYVDPLNAKIGRYDVPFAKHFRFSYQHEYRLVTQVTYAHRLEPIFIEIGSMREYAEIHRIHGEMNEAA